jgi:hypothetical protein
MCPVSTVTSISSRFQTVRRFAPVAFPFALRSQTEKDAASLNLANGYLYAATSGYFGDAPPYVGHVVAVHLSDGAAHVFNSLCSNDRQLPTPTSCSRNLSGIWSRAGVVVDPDPSMRGRIYFATGNGDFNAASGGHDYGDSVLALSPPTRRRCLGITRRRRIRSSSKAIRIWVRPRRHCFRGSLAARRR